MIQHRFPLIALVLAMLVTAVATAVSASVKAGTQIFQGLVRHVSTTNLKVYNPTTKQTQGFVIVPRFGKVFKADGRTAQAVADIKAGQYVKVYFDQKAFGAFHADRILILNSHDALMKTEKS